MRSTAVWKITKSWTPPEIRSGATHMFSQYCIKCINETWRENTLLWCLCEWYPSYWSQWRWHYAFGPSRHFLICVHDNQELHRPTNTSGALHICCPSARGAGTEMRLDVLCCCFNQMPAAGWKSPPRAVEAEWWWLQTAACHLCSLVGPERLFSSCFLQMTRRKKNFAFKCQNVIAIHYGCGWRKNVFQLNIWLFNPVWQTVFKWHFTKSDRRFFVFSFSSSFLTKRECFPLLLSFQERGWNLPRWNTRPGKHYCWRIVWDGTWIEAYPNGGALFSFQ